MGHRTYQEQGSPIGESAVVVVSYLAQNDTLWQYATDIDRKYNSCLLQNMSGFVLQNAAVLLQNMTVDVKRYNAITRSAITCSKLTIETLEQSVKYVQS